MKSSPTMNVLSTAGAPDADHDLCDDGGPGGHSPTSSSSSTAADDNDLTNLTWLQDRNLLQNMVCTQTDTTLRDMAEDNENVSPPPDVDDDDEEDDETAANDAEEAVTGGGVGGAAGVGLTVGHKNITSVPPVTYNPHLHRNAKPPYSFSSLIFMAIESSPNKALPVKDIYQWITEHYPYYQTAPSDIYQWITEHYPYYQTAPSGWKNTVRHNLSLNKCFRKLDKATDELIPIVGKGSLWCVDPDLRPNLLQAVRRTPAHIYPYMSLAKTNVVVSPPRIQLSSNSNNSSQQMKKALSAERVQSVVNIPSPNLFPFLSRRLLIPITKIIKKEKETDAAVSMLTLQCNANNTIKTDATEDIECEQVLPDSYVDDLDSSVVTVTVSPTSDHNYYQRNSTSLAEQLPSQTQVYHVIHVTEPHQRTATTITTTTTATKRKLSRVESAVKRECKEGLRSASAVVSVTDEDSNDEGMRGAEALLNLAASNKPPAARPVAAPTTALAGGPKPTIERPIILKKLRKENFKGAEVDGYPPPPPLAPIREASYRLCCLHRILHDITVMSVYPSVQSSHSSSSAADSPQDLYSISTALSLTQTIDY
ncbi:unnamed protein product [Medioppia subpectinata]|uniref:Fork-head domain-containing protein n=1 Tax=Medioppia subpectinata TaxID=1979941 RepID=A0A7R9PZ22_9ACAR|nr:unnamed protein product [Medioppia subpectinata]CAG2106618.1 unnamed protein product [Medioppia subpectinata]